MDEDDPRGTEAPSTAKRGTVWDWIKLSRMWYEGKDLHWTRCNEITQQYDRCLQTKQRIMPAPVIMTGGDCLNEFACHFKPDLTMVQSFWLTLCVFLNGTGGDGEGTRELLWDRPSHGGTWGGRDGCGTYCIRFIHVPYGSFCHSLAWSTGFRRGGASRGSVWASRSLCSEPES